MKYLPRLLAGALMLCASPVMAQVAPSSGAQRTGANVVLPDFRENLKAVPHLADNTALAAAATSAYPNGVWRDKFDNVRPARAMFFAPLTGTCTANGLVADGFHCVDGAGGNSWAGQIPDGPIDPRNYGAVANGSAHLLNVWYASNTVPNLLCPKAVALATDYALVDMDTCAIEAANAEARNSVSGGFYSKSVDLRGGKWRVNYPLNFLCFSDPQTTNGCTAGDFGDFEFKGSGATLLCATAGKPCIYGPGSGFVNLYDMLLWSVEGATAASVGIQFGKTAENEGGAWRFYNVRATGCYTTGGIYNLAGEVTRYFETNIWNKCAAGTPSDTAGPWALINDGTNHFNLPAFYGAVAPTANTALSFNDNLYVGGTVQGTGGVGGAVFLNGTRGFKFENTYLNSGKGECFYFYQDSVASSGQNANFMARQHCEGNPRTYVVNVGTNPSSPLAAVTISGLSISDPISMATTAFFGRDTTSGVDTVYLGTSNRIEFTAANVAHNLFDTPAKWTALHPEDMRLPIGGNLTNWKPTIGGTCTGVGSTGTCAGTGNSTPSRGVIRLTPGGAGIAAAGTVSMVIPFNGGLNGLACTAQAKDVAGGGTWNARVTIKETTASATTVTYAWDNNAAALTTGVAYDIVYNCVGRE